MNDSVAHVRARWTRELTDAAIRFLQGNPGETEIPTMDLHGETLPEPAWHPDREHAVRRHRDAAGSLRDHRDQDADRATRKIMNR